MLVGGDVTSGGGTKAPTVSFTTDFGSACALPAGSWLITSPSSASSSVSCSVTLDLKPAARNVARASATLCSETSGTVVVFGPWETESVTEEPREAVELPGGSWSTTSPAGRLLSTAARPTVKPAACSCAAAVSYVCPITAGTATGFGPLDTLTRTEAPSTTILPGGGSCAVTMSDCLSDGTSWTSASSPRLVSSFTAVSRDLPTSDGTLTFFLPLETRIVTMLPFGCREPATGSCSNT